MSAATLLFDPPPGLPAFDLAWLRADDGMPPEASGKLLEEIAPAVALAVSRKLLLVDADERGDLPPAVFVLGEDGSLLAEAIAPKVDKNMGLHALAVLRAGFDADGLAVAFDAHQAVAAPGETAEDMRRKWGEPGSMQRACDEGGACDAGLLTDCLLVFRAWKSGRVALATLPYHYHGKGGEPFRWAGPGRHHVMADQGDGRMGGGNLRGIRKAMSQTAVIDRADTRQMARMLGLDAEADRPRRLWHTSRAALKFLASLGFIVMASQEYGGPDDSPAVERPTPRERAGARRRKR